jgi:hypothetical protein
MQWMQLLLILQLLLLPTFLNDDLHHWKIGLHLRLYDDSVIWKRGDW